MVVLCGEWIHALLFPVFATSGKRIINSLIGFVSIGIVPHFGDGFTDGIEICLLRIEVEM